MIRRNFKFTDGSAAWLLISQVEHARISGELARAWCESFPPELVDGITHHDDGWAKWEAVPQMDATRGRPLSFLELEVVDAIKIWDDSISSARQFGPLAGAIVAGHFVGLAGGSEHASRSPAQEWLAGKTAVCEKWLDEWRALSQSNTLADSDRAQQMIYIADLLSLWLCMDGPLTAADESEVPNREMQSRSTTVLGKYRFDMQAETVTGGQLDSRVSLTPWPLRGTELELATPARAVPVGNYANWAAITVAARPFELRWRLRQSLPGENECR